MKNTSKATVKANGKSKAKVSTINMLAKNSVKNVTLEKANNTLAKALEKCETATKDRAKAFYAIKANELYKGQAEDFKSFINDVNNGVLYGVKYNQANNLANMYNYVWAVKDFSDYDSNKANVLVAYVKKDFAKVMALHKAGKISPAMSKTEITEALKADFGSKAKVIKEGKAEEVSKALNEAINTIEKLVNAYADGCKDKKQANVVTDAWAVIIDELCK